MQGSLSQLIEDQGNANNLIYLNGTTLYLDITEALLSIPPTNAIADPDFTQPFLNAVGVKSIAHISDKGIYNYMNSIGGIILQLNVTDSSNNNVLTVTSLPIGALSSTVPLIFELDKTNSNFLKNSISGNLVANPQTSGATPTIEFASVNTFLPSEPFSPPTVANFPNSASIPSAQAGNLSLNLTVSMLNLRQNFGMKSITLPLTGPQPAQVAIMPCYSLMCEDVSCSSLTQGVFSFGNGFSFTLSLPDNKIPQGVSGLKSGIITINDGTNTINFNLGAGTTQIPVTGTMYGQPISETTAAIDIVESGSSLIISGSVSAPSTLTYNNNLTSSVTLTFE